MWIQTLQTLELETKAREDFNITQSMLNGCLNTVCRNEIGTLFHKDQNKCLNLTFTYVLFLGAHLTLCLNRSLVVKSLYKEISKA